VSFNFELDFKESWWFTEMEFEMILFYLELYLEMALKLLRADL